MSDRIESFVQSGWLARLDAPDAEIAGLWRKAVTVLADAHRPENTDDTRLLRAYDAGRFAATALVRAHGLRVRAQNHHEVVLRSAGLLGGDELNRALNQFHRVRTLRAELEYGWEDVTLGERLTDALALADRVLSLVAPRLSDVRPGLVEQIQIER